MRTRRGKPLVVVARDDRQRVPRPVAIWMALVNLGMAAAIVFVLARIDSPVAYVAGAPLALVLLLTGSTYGWALFRGREVTSRSPSRGSRGSP